MIPPFQNFVSEREKSKLVMKLKNSLTFQKTGLTFQKSSITFQKSSITFQKSALTFQKTGLTKNMIFDFSRMLKGEISNSKTIVSLRICPRFNIRR